MGQLKVMASRKSLNSNVDVIRHRMLAVAEIIMWWNNIDDGKEEPKLSVETPEGTSNYISSTSNLSIGSSISDSMSMVSLNSATRTSWTTLSAESWTNRDNTRVLSSMNLMSPRATYSFQNEPPLPGLVRASDTQSGTSFPSDIFVSSSTDTRQMVQCQWTGEEAAGPMNGVVQPLENNSFDDVTPVQNLCRLFELQARCAHRPTSSTRRLCTFCKRNGEPMNVYMSHTLRSEGRVVCPILRRYICPLCGATGDNAHTISYCHLSDGTSTMEAIRTFRKSCGCVRICKHGVMRRH